MTTHAEDGRLSRQSREKMAAEIEKYAEQYRPKVLEQRKENGYTITRYEPAYAQGANSIQCIKPTGRYDGNPF